MSTLNYISFSDTLPAVHLSFSDIHGCAVFVNGKMRCWGYNLNGQLGDQTQQGRGSDIGISSVSAATFVVYAPTIDNYEVVQSYAG